MCTDTQNSRLTLCVASEYCPRRRGAQADGDAAAAWSSTSQFFLNVSMFQFAGGERKLMEMLQLACLEPELVILDEIDSGALTCGRVMCGGCGLNSGRLPDVLLERRYWRDPAAAPPSHAGLDVDAMLSGP